MKTKEGGVMDIQKQHEGFDLWWESNAIAMMCEEDEALKIWQAAQAVPEGDIIVPLRDLRIVMELAEDHCDEYIRTNEFPEVHKAIHNVKAMIEARDPAND